MSNRCDLCGKFKKSSDIIFGMQAEGDETWDECIDCASEATLETYGFKDSDARTKTNETTKGENDETV